VKITVCQDCGDVYDYTGYPTCPECIRDGDTTKKSTDIPNYYRKNKMPWTSKQHKLFEAAAHSPQVAKRVGIPVEKAKQMASEGIKHNPKQLAKALMRK